MNTYFQFEIWVDPPLKRPKKGEPAIYPVRVTISPMGPALGLMRLNLKEKSFKDALVNVQSGGVDLSAREEFGKLLYQALFSGDVGEAWVGSMGKLGGKAIGMRLRLWMNDHDLSILPWELLYCEKYGGFLATVANLAVSRYLPVLEPPDMPIKGAIEVLVAVASPQGEGLPPVREEDIQSLETALQKLSPKVHYRVERDISTKKIQQALSQGIHVLHFIGHGQPGKLSLVKETNKGVDPITDEEFAQLFSGHTHLRLVLLSACASGQNSGKDLFSGVGPMIIQKRVPAVIAMQYPTIQMDSAARFSEALYQGLNNGLPVDIAVNSARQSLSAGPLLATRDWSTPVLFMGTRYGDILNLSNLGAEVDGTLWNKVKMALQDPDLTTPLDDQFQEISALQNTLSEYIELEDTLAGLASAFSKCTQIIEKSKGDLSGANFNKLRTAWQAIMGHPWAAIDNFITSHADLTAAAPLPSLVTEVGKIDEYIKSVSPIKLSDQVIRFGGILDQLYEAVRVERRQVITRLRSRMDATLRS